MDLINDYFIIESIQKPDILDGKIFYDTLNAMGCLFPLYIPANSPKEFKEALEKFYLSNYRYLFISSHGDEENFKLVKGNFNIYDLEDLKINLKKRRVFLSTCNGGNYLMAKYFIKKGAYSVVGVPDKLEQAIAVPLWTTMGLIFNRLNDNGINFRETNTALNQLAKIYKIRLNFYSFKRNEPQVLKLYCYDQIKKRTRTDLKI